MTTFKVDQEYRLDYIKDQAKKEKLTIFDIYTHVSNISQKTKLNPKPKLELQTFILMTVYEFKYSNFTDTSNWICTFASNEFSEIDNEYPFWF
jgi:hypothetical protein